MDISWELAANEDPNHNNEALLIVRRDGVDLAVMHFDIEQLHHLHICAQHVANYMAARDMTQSPPQPVRKRSKRALTHA